MDKDIKFVELTKTHDKVFEKDILIGYLGKVDSKYQAYDREGNKIGRVCLKQYAIKKLFSQS